MASFFRRHFLAVVCACVIGLIYGLPNVFFILSLDGGYRGIPMMQTPNEDSYLARIQEILDGHPTLGSPYFFEYKEQLPITPPTGEFLYALPSLVFGLSASAVLILSKFILPTLLFFLVYLLLLRLTENGGLAQKINAITCGLLVVLGYDLVDYRTVFSYLSGTNSPTYFLLWARPVNPILGAIFLMSFLLLVWAIVRETRRPKSAIVGAGIFLALMFGSYFFSWGVAVSVLAVLLATFLLRKEYKTAGALSLILPLGVLFSSPYWYNVWRASQSPWYESSVLRSGLFYTHYPLLNKFLLATLILYTLALALDYWWKRKKGIIFQLEKWHWFCFALLLGGLWAYSQQILTGRTLWPYHFVQYTIPLSMVVFMVLLYNVIRGKNRYVWAGAVCLVATSSLFFGVYTQVSAYRHARPYVAQLQNYGSLFEWLNAKEKDCVVFVNEDRPEMVMLNTVIPALSHCNRYASTALTSLMPEERGLNNYFALLRMRGVSSERIEEYLRANRSEATGYIYSNWLGLFGVKDFPDFSDPLLEERLAAFPGEYQKFLTKDFKSELLQYRIDYILSAGPLQGKVVSELPFLKSVFEKDGLILYAFR